MRCRQAVVLAAGLGRRMGSLTRRRPKCLVEVAGRSILERLLDGLSTAGVEEVVIVTGHRADVIQRHLARRRGGPGVTLVHNQAYATTNNIVSLRAARDHVRPPFILCESDVVIDPAALASLRRPDRMLVARFEDGMEGSWLTRDRRGRVTRLLVGSAFTPEGRAWKTVNLASFSAATWSRWLAPGLEQAIRSGRTGEYYETVIASAVATGLPLHACDVGAHPWHEIDTPADLRAANHLFAGPGALVGRLG